MSVTKKPSERLWERVFQDLLLFLDLAGDDVEETSEALHWDDEALQWEIYRQLFPLWTTLP